MSPFRARAGELALVAAGFALVVAGLEVGLRLTARRAPPDATLKGYFQADAESGYDVRPGVPEREARTVEEGIPYRLWSNALGCFDDPFDGDREARAVLVVGDSFTHGDLALEDSWAKVLQGAAGARVLKCGVTGYGTRQELLKARRVVAAAGVRPRLIVLGYFMNDLEEDWVFPGRTEVGGWLVSFRKVADYRTGALVERSRAELERGVTESERGEEVLECPPGGAFQRFKCGLYRHSRLYRRFKEPLKRALLKSKAVSGAFESAAAMRPEAELPPWLPPEERSWLREAWERHFANLKAFQSFARQNGAALLVVVIPVKEQVYRFLAEAPGSQYRGVDIERPNRALRAFFEREGIEALDLAELRQYADLSPRKELDPSRDLYWRRDGHWTARGHRVAGLLVARHVLRRGLLRPPDGASRSAAIEAELAELRIR